MAVIQQHFETKHKTSTQWAIKLYRIGSRYQTEVCRNWFVLFERCMHNWLFNAHYIKLVWLPRNIKTMQVTKELVSVNYEVSKIDIKSVCWWKIWNCAFSFCLFLSFLFFCYLFVIPFTIILLKWIPNIEWNIYATWN